MEHLSIEFIELEIIHLLHIFREEHDMIFMKEVTDYEAIFIFGL